MFVPFFHTCTEGFAKALLPFLVETFQIEERFFKIDADSEAPTLTHRFAIFFDPQAALAAGATYVNGEKHTCEADFIVHMWVFCIGAAAGNSMERRAGCDWGRY